MSGYIWEVVRLPLYAIFLGYLWEKEFKIIERIAVHFN